MMMSSSILQVPFQAPSKKSARLGIGAKRYEGLIEAEHYNQLDEAFFAQRRAVSWFLARELRFFS